MSTTKNPSQKKPTAVEFFIPQLGKVKIKVLTEATLSSFITPSYPNSSVYQDEVLKKAVYNYKKNLGPFLEMAKEKNEEVFFLLRDEVFWLCQSLNPKLTPLFHYKEKDEASLKEEGFVFLRDPSKVERLLSKFVKGQRHILTEVMDILYRAYAGLKDEHRPIAILLLSGPSGTGKTLLAKVLAALLFGEEEPNVNNIHSPSKFLRIDCSEFTHKGDVNRLIGSPPGFIGHDEGSPMAQFLKKNPDGGVILFDEAEKADDSLRNFMLGLFDRGEMTDNTGDVVSAKNHIFILTTNVGSKEAAQNMSKNPIGFCDEIGDDTSICLIDTDGSRRSKESSKRYDILKKETHKKLNETMPPEFLNRLDVNLVFDYLNNQHLRLILRNEVAAVQKRMSKKGNELVLSKEAEDVILQKSKTNIFGARDIRRTLESEVVTPVARMMGRSKNMNGNIIYVESDGDSIKIGKLIDEDVKSETAAEQS